MYKTELKKILKDIPVEPVSSAYITYLFNGGDASFMEGIKEIEEKTEDTPEDIKNQEIIAGLSDPKDYFRMMRQMMPKKVKDILMYKILDTEGEIGEMIREKILTSGNDDFIENTTNYMIRSSFDYNSWILENYDRVRSAYARSQLCLVLGLRKCENCDGFLIDQIEELLREDPDELYEQGPLIALYLVNDIEIKI